MYVRTRTAVRGVLLTAALLPAAAWAPAFNNTIPAVVTSAEGNSDNAYPFNGDPMRYQQVINASEFPGGARWITGMALRPDSSGGAAFSETLGDVAINLSTSPKRPNNISQTFANNVGTDDTVVFRGQLALASGFTGPNAGPKDFDIYIRFEKSFYYDPAAGSLLVDVRNYSGGKTTQLDAHDAQDSTARVWNYDPEATTATKSDPFPSAGLVIKFFSN